jgi:hypothetical protein
MTALPQRIATDCPARRGGMTLVEMLVATAMTLIVMGIVAQLFGLVANTLNGSRDTIKMSADVRSVANMLRRDLAGITVKPLPPVAADSDAGYLEIIEGTVTDAAAGFSQLTGDCDDVLMFTTRSMDQPFVGRFTPSAGVVESIESNVAEVVWFCRASPSAFQVAAGSTLYTLYRRQLLVTEYPYAGGFSNVNNAVTAALPGVLYDYDLSLRPDGTVVRPNSLSDLSRREFRAWHDTVGPPSAARFPYNNTLSNLSPLTDGRSGEDVVLTNVISFDVRVFDPRAPIRTSTSTGVATTPGDPGWSGGSNTGAIGAYVDLGWAGTSVTSFGGSFPPSGNTALGSSGMRVSNTPNSRTLPLIYDTWSTHYESNGIDDDGDGTADEGTNGIDDNSDGVIDDSLEAETSPPYPVPLRGMEVRIRTFEPTSRQIRQVTVRHTFVPH